MIRDYLGHKYVQNAVTQTLLDAKRLGGFGENRYAHGMRFHDINPGVPREWLR